MLIEELQTVPASPRSPLPAITTGSPADGNATYTTPATAAPPAEAAAAPPLKARPEQHDTVLSEAGYPELSEKKRERIELVTPGVYPNLTDVQHRVATDTAPESFVVEEAASSQTEEEKGSARHTVPDCGVADGAPPEVRHSPKNEWASRLGVGGAPGSPSAPPDIGRPSEARSVALRCASASIKSMGKVLFISSSIGMPHACPALPNQLVSPM